MMGMSHCLGGKYDGYVTVTLGVTGMSQPGGVWRC